MAGRAMRGSRLMWELRETGGRGMNPQPVWHGAEGGVTGRIMCRLAPRHSMIGLLHDHRTMLLVLRIG